MTLTEWLNRNWEKDNILPPSMDAQTALDFLEQYLLGEDWYVINPYGAEQANTEIVHTILKRYSKTYKKEYKQYLKNIREK